MKLKRKGCYGFGDDLVMNKNHSQQCVAKAAVDYLIHGVSIEQTIMLNTNIYDFMITVKVPKSNRLVMNGLDIQKTSRVIASNRGYTMSKVMPAGGEVGAYKRKANVTQELYDSHMEKSLGQWCEEVCTKNQSRYEIRYSVLLGGSKMIPANNVAEVSVIDLNHQYYINESRKLVSIYEN